MISRFPLAVHRDDGTTVWHTITPSKPSSCNTASEAGELAKGQEASLVGYQPTRAQPTREGTKTVIEIYAVAVTRR